MGVDLRTGKGLRYQLPQPYISAHDGKLTSPLIRKALAAARERVKVGNRVPTCPAAALKANGGPEGLTVGCGVERSLITEHADPSSLASFCLGDFTACPTWRADKERVWDGKLVPLVSSAEGV